MTVKSLRRCLLTITVAGIAACGNDHPPAGPDLTLAATIAVSPDSIRLMINDTARVRAAVLNVEGDTLPAAPVAFLSSDTTVATIDASGLVRARAGGVSDIEVRSDTITTIVQARVRVNGTLVVSPRVAFLQSADTVQLSVVVKDSNGAVLPSAPVQYRSADTGVAQVSPSGRVSFGGSAGSVMIHVSSAGRTDGALITAVVRRQPSGEPQLAAASGNSAFTVTDSMLQRVNLFTGTVIDEVVVGYLVFDDLVVNGAGTRAYLARGGSIYAVDLAADTVRSHFVSSPAALGSRALVLAPGDSILYFTADSQLYRVRLPTFTATPVLTCRSPRLASRNDMLYAICGTALGSSVREFNMRTNTAGRAWSPGLGAGNLAISPDGQQLYLNGYRDLTIWDLGTGETVATVRAASVYGLMDIGVQPTTGLVWLSSEYEGRVYVIDPVLQRVVRTLQTGGRPGALAFGVSGTGLILNPDRVYPYTTHWFDFVR